MKSGMPQLDPSSFASQLFWLTVCFVALYVIMARYLVPRIQEVLETRQNRIAHDLDRSAQLKREAEEVKQAYEQTLMLARTRAQTLLADTTQAMAQTEAVRRAELDVVIAKQLADSDAAIAAARQRALEQMAPVATELTALIVETLIGHKPSPQRISGAMEELAKARQM